MRCHFSPWIIYCINFIFWKYRRIHPLVINRGLWWLTFLHLFNMIYFKWIVYTWLNFKSLQFSLFRFLILLWFICYAYNFRLFTCIFGLSLIYNQCTILNFWNILFLKSWCIISFNFKTDFCLIFTRFIIFYILYFYNINIFSKKITSFSSI